MVSPWPWPWLVWTLLCKCNAVNLTLSSCPPLYNFFSKLSLNSLMPTLLTHHNHSYNTNTEPYPVNYILKKDNTSEINDTNLNSSIPCSRAFSNNYTFSWTLNYTITASCNFAERQKIRTTEKDIRTDTREITAKLPPEHIIIPPPHSIPVASLKPLLFCPHWITLQVATLAGRQEAENKQTLINERDEFSNVKVRLHPEWQLTVPEASESSPCPRLGGARAMPKSAPMPGRQFFLVGQTRLFSWRALQYGP